LREIICSRSAVRDVGRSVVHIEEIVLKLGIESNSSQRHRLVPDGKITRIAVEILAEMTVTVDAGIAF
jgi:hypothetical protein